MITTQQLFDNMEGRAEIARDSFDLTAVYGWHLSPDHADEVLEVIEPSSIVFVEGTMRDPEYAALRLGQHIMLADARLACGEYDEDLQTVARVLTNEFVHRRYSPATEHDPFTFSLYSGLVAKNCIIFPADYLNLGDGSPGIIDTAELAAEVSTKFETVSQETLEELISLELRLYLQQQENGSIREEHAVAYTLMFLERCRKAATTLIKGDNHNDRLPAFIIYGLAHRNSLTERLNAFGLVPKSICVNTSDWPTEEMPDLAKPMMPEEARLAIRAHYLSILTVESEATQE